MPNLEAGAAGYRKVWRSRAIFLGPLSEEKKSRDKVLPSKVRNGAARTLQALCEPAARKMHAGVKNARSSADKPDKSV